MLVEEVDHIESYYPDGRCACGGVVEPESEPALRHQVFDLPEVRYTVTEYRQYGGCCTRCGERHLAVLPDWVARGRMGAGLSRPRLIGEIGLLNGQYRMSLRQVRTYLQARWGLEFSLGAISESQGKLTEWLEPLYAQLGAAVRRTSPVNRCAGWRFASASCR